MNFGFSGSFVNPAWLSTFYAEPTGTVGDVIFHWSTTLEFRNLGFVLFAYDGVEWKKVTPSLIRSQVVDSDGQLTQYELRMQNVPELYFSIVDIDLDLELGLHGPFRLGVRYGSEQETSEQSENSSSSLDPQSKSELKLRKLLEERLKDYQGMNLDTLQNANPVVDEESIEPRNWFVKALSVFAALVSTPAYAEDLAYLHVDEPGVYRVYADDLGLSKNKARTTLRKMTVSHQGESIPVYFGRHNRRDYLEFIGDAYQDLYTDRNTYVLGIERRNNRNIIPYDRSKIPSRDGSATSHYWHTETVDQQTHYLQSSPSLDRDPYYSHYVFGYGSPASESLSVEVLDLVPDVSGVTVAAEVWSNNDLPGRDDDHQAVLSVDGVDVDSLFFDGAQAVKLSGILPSGVLIDGSNALNITAPADHGVRYDLLYIDSVSVNYPRALKMQDGQLVFSGSANVFQIEDFSSRKIRVYRRDGNGLHRVRGIRKLSVEDGWTARIAGSSLDSEYFVLETEHPKLPEIQLLDQFSGDLRVGDAEYLVIAASEFVEDEALQRLVSRRAGSYTTKVVNLDEVIQHFGYGRYGVSGIKDYLSYAYDNLNLKMVLLVGDDTRDYLGNELSGQVSYLPTPYGRVHAQIGFAPLDSLFVDFDDDGLPNVALGRLPVNSAQDLENIVVKIEQYENRDYDGVTLSSDIPDTTHGGYSYKLDSESLRNLFPTPAIYSAHLEDDDIDTANQSIVDSINSGIALLSYHGHSGYEALGSNWISSTAQKLFDNGDAENLINEGKPVLFTQWGCWTSNFVHPKANILSANLLNSKAGAVGVTGSPALTDAFAWGGLSRMFSSYLPGGTLGEAMLRARSEYHAGLSASQQEAMRGILSGWTLLGDPALRVWE